MSKLRLQQTRCLPMSRGCASGCLEFLLFVQLTILSSPISAHQCSLPEEYMEHRCRTTNLMVASETQAAQITPCELQRSYLCGLIFLAWSEWSLSCVLSNLIYDWSLMIWSDVWSMMIWSDPMIDPRFVLICPLWSLCFFIFVVIMVCMWYVIMRSACMYSVSLLYMCSCHMWSTCVRDHFNPADLCICFLVSGLRVCLISMCLWYTW